MESADNYTRIWTHGRSYLLREAMRTLEQRLDAHGFVRAHRRALVRACVGAQPRDQTRWRRVGRPGQRRARAALAPPPRRLRRRAEAPRSDVDDYAPAPRPRSSQRSQRRLWSSVIFVALATGARTSCRSVTAVVQCRAQSAAPRCLPSRRRRVAVAFVPERDPYRGVTPQVFIRSRALAFARASGDVAGFGGGAGGASCGVSARGVSAVAGDGVETTARRRRGRRRRGTCSDRSHPHAAAKSSSRRPAISTRCSNSSASVSGRTRSRTCRLRSRPAIEHVVPRRSLDAAGDARHLAQRLASFLRIGPRLEFRRIGQRSAARAAARGRPSARRRGRGRPSAAGKRASSVSSLDPREIEPFRSGSRARVGRNDCRRCRAHVVGAAARAAGIELDADDALRPLALDARLHAGRRLAAEQPAAEPDGEALEVRSTRSDAANSRRPLRR